MKNAEEGITLMALIITIIVLVILVAITVNAAYNSGIIQMGAKGAKDYAEAAIDENKIMKETSDYMESVVTQIQELLQGESFNSRYVKVGNIYLNSPDLSGFKPENTYYVTYGEDGNSETIYGRMDKVEKPKAQEWYDYENKKWANVVTVNDEYITYWVWIPRYVYKINGDQTVDVKFVSKKDKDIEIAYGSNGEVVDVSDYKLPESFTFDDQNLSGYWISKYEIQQSEDTASEILYFIPQGNGKAITTSNPQGTYTVYVDGQKVATKASLPYTLNNYQDVCLVSETTNKIVGSKKKEESDTKNIVVDLSGFNESCTKYVTYDETGKEEEGENIVLDDSGKATNIPPNWYDYGNKKWANIVTENGGLKSYWTYIPRYEYKIWPEAKYVEIKFIPESQTEPDKDYQIPESFTFGGKQLKGYWISKYEIQEK